MKVLSEVDLKSIEANDLNYLLATEKANALGYKIKAAELQMKVMSLEIEKLRQGLEGLKRDADRAKEAKQETLKRIAKKRRLAPGWGFNPDTGEIIEGDM